MSVEDDISRAIITAASNPSSSGNGQSLAELYALVSAAGIADSLDALSVLSALLPNRDPAARDLIAIMGECSSAKEVVMAVQEEVEKIAEHADDGKDEEGDESAIEKKTSWTERLSELVGLCRAAIPRLRLRKSSASETLKPLLSELRRAMEAVSSPALSGEARDLMIAVHAMVKHVSNWVKDLPAIEPEELTKCQLVLKSVLDHALVIFRHNLGYIAAQEALNVCFPRLKMPGEAPDSSDNQDSRIVETYVSTYDDLGFSQDNFTSSPSTASVVVLVHTWLTSSFSLLASIPSSFLQILLTMLQPNSNLHDDALAFLLLVLHQNQTSNGTELSPDIVNALMPPLVVLSSTYPSPSTRHQAFRIVSLLLANAPSQLRLQFLADLVANCEYPQMRIAAVGLVKDALLEALNIKTTSNVFGTSMFMRIFGPLLFRPSPPDLFDQRAKLNLEEFLESPEPKRITEVLSLYYVVLLRDRDNTTGIRDKDMLGTVEKNLLNPLGSWLEMVIDNGSEGHAVVPLVSLRMGLQRVQEAKANLLHKSQ